MKIRSRVLLGVAFVFKFSYYSCNDGSTEQKLSSEKTTEVDINYEDIPQIDYTRFN